MNNIHRNEQCDQLSHEKKTLNTYTAYKQTTLPDIKRQVIQLSTITHEQIKPLNVYYNNILTFVKLLFFIYER